ncbi:MAG: tRNA glutamyl-Q(34) synthetase GluQRS [Gallionellaceae bacterium]|nr:MAG: tRNA glutamyl-Q(34) synthetase GluQRS [Gallionellaceae bacterium]
MPSPSVYRGRFAPSPTGPLHFGSLVAAVGSYLDAKHHHGTWLVRIEDLDTPRCVPGAAEDILRTLTMFGLHSDEPILHQSQRTAAYEEALQRLKDCGAVYPCCCTRKEIADSAMNGIERPVYPGTCRNGIPAGREGRAWRVFTDYPHPQSLPRWEREDKPFSLRWTGGDGGKAVAFNDALQGHISQHLETEIGDFVVKRADGLFAYQLAAVVDDAYQGITHVVRGADLLTSTARQIYLQRLLGMNTPAYMHLPVAVNAAGEKLSKQTLAAPVDTAQPVATLLRVLDFLQQQPPAELGDDNLGVVWDWAIRNWDASKLRGASSLPAL